MLYNCSAPLDKENFLTRAQMLASRGEIVELKVKRQRSLSQNAYLHVILSYFASIYGETIDFVKRQYFKVLVNPELFIRTKNDNFLGQVKVLRSSADLTTEELSLAIERFRNWASSQAGIYLPTADEHVLISQMEVEIARHNSHL